MDVESAWGPARRATWRLLGPESAGSSTHVVYGVLFAASVVAGRLTVSPDTGVALVWPAAGVTFVWFLTAMAVSGTAWGSGSSLVTAAIVVITTPLNMASGMEPVAAFVFAVGNAATGFLGALAYRLARRRGTFGLTRLRHIPALVVASAAAGAGSAIWGPLYVHLAEGASLAVLWQSVARNGIGTLVFGAMLLRLLSPAPAVRPAAWPWQGGLAVIAVGGYWSAFIAAPHLPITFVLSMITVLAALVLSVDGLLMYILLTGAFILTASIASVGPYALADAADGVFIAQAYVGAQTVIGLLLSLVREQQERLILDLHDARAEAERQSEMLGRVVAGMTEAVIAVDDRRVIMGNEAARSMFGISVGESLTGTVLSSDGAEGDLPLDRARQGRSVTREILLEGAGGEPARVLAVSAHPLGGRPGSAMAVVRDVTDHRRQVSELSAFASVVAHDLLNPIGAVEGWLEILDEQIEEETGVVSPSVMRARSSARRLREIVTGLHGYSVARGGELSPASVDLQVLAERLAAGRIESATMGSAAAAPYILVDAPQVVFADEALIAQVLDNLLGNSIKYTAPGQRSRIAVTATDAVQGFVTVRVDDDGIGIPEADRDKVFEEFHRVAGHAGSYVGTGLGLSICRRMIERHGGRIHATESPTGGTRMEFTLPVPADDEADRLTWVGEEVRAAAMQGQAAKAAARGLSVPPEGRAAVPGGSAVEVRSAIDR